MMNYLFDRQESKQIISYSRERLYKKNKLRKKSKSKMEYMDCKFSEFASGGNELIKIENNVVLQ